MTKLIHRSGILVAVAAWSAVPVVAAAQTVPPSNRAAQYLDPKEGLTLDGLVALALKQAPALVAVRARIDAAVGDRVQAGLRPNPSASAERRQQFGGLETQTMVGIAWPLDLFRRDARVAVAVAGVSAAQFMADDEVREWTANVRERATLVLAALRQLEITDERARFAKTRLDLLTARVQVGSSPPLDRDLADVEWRRAQTEVLMWQASADEGMAALKSVVGLAPQTPLRLALPIDIVAFTLPTSPAAPAADALMSRPDVKALESEVRRAEAVGVKAATEARLDLGVYAAYMNRQLDVASNRDRMHEATVGVTVSLPWRNRQQGAIAAAGAMKRAADASVAARKLDVAAEIDAARVRERAAADALALYRGGLMDLAGRNLAVVRESFDLGRGTLFTVIEEERRYLELQSAFTAALREMIDARTALLRALGVAS